MRPNRISVVVITRNEGEELRRTVENLDDTLPASGEIVVVDDGSTDGSANRVAPRRGRIKLLRKRGLGVARARNLGARHASGDTLVFADAHIRLGEFWWRPLIEIVSNPKVGGAAPAIMNMPKIERKGYGATLTGPDFKLSWLRKKGNAPFAAPILPGCCMAMRRDVFEASGGWDEGMLQRGGVDNEGCVRLWLFGFELMVAPEVVVRHKFRKQSPYPVGWPQYLHNRLRLAFAHLNPRRMGKVVGAMREHEAFGEALALVLEGDITARRREMLARRVRSDDWFFEKFGMKW
ncbi:MAG: glycosyltransferase [Acidobacteriota bacterium]|nr:glycosyltransferase [Acidobacteriota bacterium]